jgi:hypothetical protein
MPTSAVPTGFEAQFQTFVNYAAPVLQLLFWVVVGFSAIWAAFQFKRYVDFMTGSMDEAGSAEMAETADAAGSEEIDVDKFVE